MIIETEYMFLIFLFIGMVVGAIIVRIICGKIKGQKIGTLYIDMRDDSRDICRFLLEKDLQSISQMESVSLKVVNLVTESKHLESFNDD